MSVRALSGLALRAARAQSRASVPFARNGLRSSFHTQSFLFTADASNSTAQQEEITKLIDQMKFDDDGVNTPDADFKDVNNNDATLEKEPEAEPLVIKESAKGEATKSGFQAETQKLLHIVAHSLYSDRQVFVREIISNASDALEKLRYMQSTNQVSSSTEDLSIKLQVDEKQKLFIIQDNGVGMTKEELVNNLGTIAHSGSKKFLNELKTEDSSAKEGIIGQFGVGFYSTFMVGDKVTVYTKSCKPDSVGYCWTSDGLGEYAITEADNVEVGTKIIINVKDDALEFVNKNKLSDLVKNMSNFVSFPVSVNSQVVNTVQPLWTMDAKDITEEDHKKFYNFISAGWDTPKYQMQFKTDAPVDIKSLFYIPSMHMEKFGMGRMDPGVSLYSRKVLIQKNPKLLPEWMRFVKGVVDSADLPLNLSREMLQDNNLVRKLRNVLSSRIIKFLEKQMKRDSEKYDAWFEEFGNFLREGVCTDSDNKDDIAKLLRMESSKQEPKKMVSLKEYVSNMKEDQKDIYYVVSSSRAMAEQSPYMEAFKSKDMEVLIFTEGLDEVVMNHVQSFSGKRVLSIDSKEAFGAVENKTEKSEEAKAQEKGVCEWFEQALGGKVKKVETTSRVNTVPAIISTDESAFMRRMMKNIDKNRLENFEPQLLEINPDHDVIKNLMEIKDKHPELAESVACEIFDTAMITANLVDDPQMLLKNMNNMISKTLTMATKQV